MARAKSSGVSAGTLRILVGGALVVVLLGLLGVRLTLKYASPAERFLHIVRGDNGAPMASLAARDASSVDMGLVMQALGSGARANTRPAPDGLRIHLQGQAVRLLGGIVLPQEHTVTLGVQTALQLTSSADHLTLRLCDEQGRDLPIEGKLNNEADFILCAFSPVDVPTGAPIYVAVSWYDDAGALCERHMVRLDAPR